MQIFIQRTGENAILMHFHAIVSDICSSAKPENILTINYRRFSSSGKLSNKFHVSSVKVIDSVGVLSFC